MALQRIFVGIDVSKDWLDVWLAPHRFERISNDAAGWAAMTALLRSFDAPPGVVVAFEASGGYELGLRQSLLEEGFEVRRLNPLRVRLYAPEPRPQRQERPDRCATHRPLRRGGRHHA